MIRKYFSLSLCCLLFFLSLKLPCLYGPFIQQEREKIISVPFIAGGSTENKFRYKSITRALSLSQQVLPKIAVSHSRSLWHISNFPVGNLQTLAQVSFDLMKQSN